MSFRVVQRGTPPLVVCWLYGPVDVDKDGIDDLAEALPGLTIVADAKSSGSLTEARAIAGVSSDAPLVLVGYSAGCQPVRALMLTGAKPVAVVTIDGNHAGLPPASAQLSVWRELAAEARRGERQWIATCCLQRYVERLAQPYMATSTLLSRVLDLPELATMKASQVPLPSYPAEPVFELHEGGLDVLAYPSTDCDKAAHAAQMRHVLPRVAREYLAPMLIDSPATERHPWQDSTLSLGERCVRFCEAEMAAGVREAPPGSNTSPRIRAYLEPCARRATGKPLGLTAAAWCAAAQCFAQRECLRPGESGAHGYFCSGAELTESAKSVGTWRDPGYTPRVGDLVILLRKGVSDPASAGWERHVARVRTAPVDGAVTTIGGNEENGWRVSDLRLDDARITGWVAYPV